MPINKQIKQLFFLSILVTCSFYATLYAESPKVPNDQNNHFNAVKQHFLNRRVLSKKTVYACLLPKNHPLQPSLKQVFRDSKMFKSSEYFRRAGFDIKRGHKHLMVAAHPYIPGYLFKKFPDYTYPQLTQLENFVRRVEGAKIVRNLIKKHKFKHLIVPQKWIYKLPSSFSRVERARSYILIVENMDICSEAEVAAKYYNMDKEMLKELCTLLHALGGCDAYPRNQPFTRSGKIAFIDTEHVGGMPGHFQKHIIPALNPSLQSYALALWAQLDEQAGIQPLKEEF
jgi:hypothetical protein